MVADRCNAQLLSVPEARTLAARHLLGLAALIVDSVPAPGGVLPLVETARKIAPRLPIIVYYHDTASSIEAASQYGRQPETICKIQLGDSGEPERLRRLLAPFLRDPLAARFAVQVKRVIPAPSGAVALFIQVALQDLASGWERRPDVARFARAAGVSPRQLERRLRQARLPPPRRLLDWLVVLWTAWLSEQGGVSATFAAGHLSMSARDWQRVLARTSGACDGPRFADSVAAFARRVDQF
jgi:hypothetical protein